MLARAFFPEGFFLNGNGSGRVVCRRGRGGWFGVGGCWGAGPVLPWHRQPDTKVLTPCKLQASIGFFSSLSCGASCALRQHWQQQADGSCCPWSFLVVCCAAHISVQLLPGQMRRPDLPHMKAALVALQLLLVGSLQLTAAMASVSWRVQLWLGGGVLTRRLVCGFVVTCEYVEWCVQWSGCVTLAASIRVKKVCSPFFWGALPCRRFCHRSSFCHAAVLSEIAGVLWLC